MNRLYDRYDNDSGIFIISNIGFVKLKTRKNQGENAF
jgi:hypothetical protein